MVLVAHARLVTGPLLCGHPSTGLRAGFRPRKISFFSVWSRLVVEGERISTTRFGSTRTNCPG
jgi:hypothetical protein